MKKIVLFSFLFAAGAFGYMGLEVLWRGFSHWTMGLCGGICMIALTLLDNRLPLIWLVQKSVMGSLFITTVEFSCGCIVNLWLKMDIWSYQSLPVNLFGQICLPFFGVWFLMSLIVFTVFGIAKTFLRIASHSPTACTIYSTGDME